VHGRLFNLPCACFQQARLQCQFAAVIVIIIIIIIIIVVVVVAIVTSLDLCSLQQ
jgi:hypothetical protein